MFLDNVTCVMLFGPLTYSLCRQMSLNPRWMYLPMAICATIGGTGTLIGDPPNIVIGSKLAISFEKFLQFNFPIIAFAGLPVASLFLYWKLKDRLSYCEDGERVKLDITKLEEENKITDMPKFVKLAGILTAVLFSLLLAPVHHIEPAWFTVMAMFAGAILFQPHSIHHYLMAVEWDTLFFFACLFVLVESLSELGVIKMLGDTIAGAIITFPEAQRQLLAIIMLLWVCSFGSAFLESLPFTTTIVYVLLDMKQQETPGFDPEVLAWPLSVGACVGGIGSIMGSSANLVSMAVSGRQADKEDEKIMGSDFLKNGLPTMMIVIFICMLWQIFIFEIIHLSPN
jgi:Na+/H+ antiporter NhaD/arsenite permease-like protein